MITLHFTVSNYSEDFIELALCAEDKVLTSQQVTKYAWEKDENNHFEQEGTEALGILGLQVLPDTDLVD